MLSAPKSSAASPSPSQRPPKPYFGAEEESLAFRLRFNDSDLKDDAIWRSSTDAYPPDLERLRAGRLGFAGDVVKGHSLLAHALDLLPSNTSVPHTVVMQKRKQDLLTYEEELKGTYTALVEDFNHLIHDLDLWPRWYYELEDEPRGNTLKAISDAQHQMFQCTQPLAPLLARDAELKLLSDSDIDHFMDKGKPTVVTSEMNNLLRLAMKVKTETSKSNADAFVYLRRANWQLMDSLSAAIDDLRNVLRSTTEGKVHATQMWEKSRKKVIPTMKLRSRKRRSQVFVQDSIMVRTLKSSLTSTVNDSFEHQTGPGMLATQAHDLLGALQQLTQGRSLSASTTLNLSRTTTAASQASGPSARTSRLPSLFNQEKA